MHESRALEASVFGCDNLLNESLNVQPCSVVSVDPTIPLDVILHFLS